MIKQFKKIALCIGTSVILLTGNSSLAAYAQSNYTVSDEFQSEQALHEEIIRDHFECINNDEWLQWADSFIPSVQSLYVGLVSNQNNHDKNLGFLTVNNADVLSISQVPNSYAPRYIELESIYETGNYSCYLVGLNLTVNEETKYFSSGSTNRLIVVAEDDGEWGVAANCYYAENITRGVAYGYLSGDVNNPPETITVDQWTGVYDEDGVPVPEGNPITLDFDSFVMRTVLGEIGYMGYSAHAIRAVTISDKMFAWWCVLGHYRDLLGCDILGEHDVAYSPDIIGGNFPTSVLTVINSVMDYYVVASNGRFFSVGANNYSSYNYQGSGVVVQSGAETLSLSGKTWQEIIHYYLDNSTYNVPYSVGVVQIGMVA